MFQLCKKVASHFCGGVAGLFTGLVAGFYRGCSQVSPYAVAAVPLVMLYDAFRGAYKGATKGFNAGAFYISTVVNEIDANRMLWLLNSKKKIYLVKSDLLNNEQLEKFRAYLTKEMQNGTSKAAREIANVLSSQLVKYEFFCREEKSKIPDRIQKPLWLMVDGVGQSIHDFDEFKKHVETCLKEGTPMIPNNHFIIGFRPFFPEDVRAIMEYAKNNASKWDVECGSSSLEVVRVLQDDAIKGPTVPVAESKHSANNMWSSAGGEEPVKQDAISFSATNPSNFKRK